MARTSKSPNTRLSVGVPGSNELDVSDEKYRTTCHIHVGSAIVPIEYAAPFTLKYPPGMEPFMFQLHMSDTSVLPEPGSGNGTPCKFVFSTPAASGGRTDVELSGWYLVRVEPSNIEDATSLVTFADERWRLQYKRFSAEYNIQWPDGSFRWHTVDKGEKWKAHDAIVDFLTKAGYKPDTSRLSLLKRGLDLPNNLGNSRGGGWVDATYQEILEPMLRILDANIYFINGQPHITDKSGDIAGGIPKLRAIPRVDDTVAFSRNGWEKPRRFRIMYEIKAEAALENLYTPARTTASQSPASFFDAPENVMPKLTASVREHRDWWEAAINKEKGDEWDEIAIVVAGYQPMALTVDEVDDNIAKNWYLPFLFPFKRQGPHGPIIESSNPTTNASIIEAKLWLMAQCRMHWHRTYRITYPTSNEPLVNGYRSMTGIRFGRLTPGGDTVSRGAVFADWSEETTAAVRLRDNPFDSQFGRSYDFNPERAAPFVADWVAESGNELIFELRPVGTMMLGQEKIVPGIWSVTPNYGTWFEMTRDGYLGAQELQAELRPDWRFRAIVSGRVVGSISIMENVATAIGKISGRSFVVEVPGFTDGGMDAFDVKESAITANFGFSKAQLNTQEVITEVFPEVLLNESAISSRANDLAKYFKSRFELGQAGGILIPGVEPAYSGIWPGGDIYEMSIVVGDPDPWSVTTQYVVLPGIPSPPLLPEERDGRIPQIIAWE